MKRILEMMVLVPAAGFALPILIDSALKGAVLMAVVLLSVLALRRAPAALRHLVLVVAMLGLLALPLLSLTLPAWQVLPAWAQTQPKLSAESTPSPAGGTFGSDFAGLQATQTSAANPIAEAAAETASPWVLLVVWAWGIGAAVLGLWLTFSQWALWRLKRSAEPASDTDQLALLEELKAALKVNRRVELLLHPDRAMPMTWGIFKTRLLLPAESQDWTESRTRAVLLHELAHVKRRDCLTQLLARAVCAVHWFNPLVWIAARRLAAERELACDDLVLNSGIRASDYAEHLLRIATAYEDRPMTGAAALAMARKSRLEGRLTSILNQQTNRNKTTHRVTLAVVAGLAMLALPVAMMRAVAEEPDEKTIEELAAEWAEENLIDDEMQKTAEKALEEAKRKPSDAVLIDPSTGEVLAEDVTNPTTDEVGDYLKKYPDDVEMAKSGRELERLERVRGETRSAGFGRKHPTMVALAKKIEIQRGLIIARGKLLDARDPSAQSKMQLFKLEANLELLLANGLGKAHPEVRALEQRIADLEQLLELQQAAPEKPLSGIGIVIHQGDDGFVVMDLLEGGPAAASNALQAGDRIISIAEGDKGAAVLTAPFTIAELVKRLRGKPGSKVRLTVQRGDAEKPQTIEVPIVRQILELDPPGVEPLQPEKEKDAEPVLLQLERIKAAEAKEAIDDLLTKTGRGKVIADPKTNSLIYIGDTETLDLVRKVLEWLDSPEKE